MMAFGITTLSNECRYAKILHAECQYAESIYTKCRYAECHYSQCCGATDKYISYLSQEPFVHSLIHPIHFTILCTSSGT
jgi:hypothetical protein